MRDIEFRAFIKETKKVLPVIELRFNIHENLELMEEAE